MERDVVILVTVVGEFDNSQLILKLLKTALRKFFNADFLQLQFTVSLNWEHCILVEHMLEQQLSFCPIRSAANNLDSLSAVKYAVIYRTIFRIDSKIFPIKIEKLSI